MQDFQFFKKILTFLCACKSEGGKMENRYSSHTVTHLTVHIVWVTKYRYKVLEGDIQRRCRELIIQICDTEDIRILKGVVSKDHVHMHIEYPPSKSISEIIRRIKGRTSRILQKEYTELRKRYWGRHFWGIGYGAWSTGNVTDKIIEEYLKHHKVSANDITDFELE